MNLLHTKKFRYGSVSLALTVVIIAAVILVNAIFTALSAKFVWYVDMTAEQIYTLSDEAKELLDLVNRDTEVTLMFCADRDELEAESASRYALYTALDISKDYPNVKIRYVDPFTNPTAVMPYKETSGQDINSNSIIVLSGTESRVYTLSALFTYDSAGSEIIGYNGEQRLVSAILSVTQVESPVACFTATHGEAESLATDPSLMTLLYETGYDCRPINLATEEIPDDCRLLVIFDPQSDFLEKDATCDISELSKIDKFLDENNAVMTFFDYETPTLPNLEAFLAEWGVKIARSGEANYLIKDTDHSFTAAGFTNVAAYEQNGLGASITKQLRSAKYPKSVLFPYATAIDCPESYESIYDDETGYYTASYFSNGVSRDRYNVFTSFETARAVVGETTVSDAAPFTYMTVTRETKMDPERNEEIYAYLFACSSTQFASSGALDSSYGNHAVLAYACNVMGRAVIPVTLDCKYFTDTEINSITAKEANQYTVVLAVVPASLIFIAGIYVIVRRKYA